MRYVSLDIKNLDIIQAKVLECFPESKKNMSRLFYIDNNYQRFMAIEELRKELSDLGLLEYVHSFGFYNVLPTGLEGTTAHIDNSPGDYSFNIPIANCNNTFVNFYTSDNDPELRLTPDGTPYYFVDKSTCKLVDRLEMSKPHIINVKEIHNITNDNSTTRITLLVRLTANWNYLEWGKQRKLRLESNLS